MNDDEPLPASDDVAVVSSTRTRAPHPVTPDWDPDGINPAEWPLMDNLTTGGEGRGVRSVGSGHRQDARAYRLSVPSADSAESAVVSSQQG